MLSTSGHQDSDGAQWSCSMLLSFVVVDLPSASKRVYDENVRCVSCQHHVNALSNVTRGGSESRSETAGAAQTRPVSSALGTEYIRVTFARVC